MVLTEEIKKNKEKHPKTLKKIRTELSLIMLTLLLALTTISFGNGIPNIPPNIPNLPELSEDTVVPNLPTGDKTERNGIRKLLSNTTVMMNAKLNVIVPLEIISDIDIDAMVIDDERIEVPFSIELNKEPDLQDYYRIKYSETAIDIDGDGNIDTYIYSPKFLNKRIIEDNMVVVEGVNISKEGYHTRKVYMTIEVRQ